VRENLVPGNEIDPVERGRHAPLCLAKRVLVVPGNIDLHHRLEEIFIRPEFYPVLQELAGFLLAVHICDAYDACHCHHTHGDHNPVFYHGTPSLFVGYRAFINILFSPNDRGCPLTRTAAPALSGALYAALPPRWPQRGPCAPQGCTPRASTVPAWSRSGC